MFKTNTHQSTYAFNKFFGQGIISTMAPNCEMHIRDQTIEDSDRAYNALLYTNEMNHHESSNLNYSEMSNASGSSLTAIAIRSFSVLDLSLHATPSCY